MMIIQINNEAVGIYEGFPCKRQDRIIHIKMCCPGMLLRLNDFIPCRGDLFMKS